MKHNINGPVVIRRLEEIDRSLSAARENIRTELSKRSEIVDYVEVYVSELARIQTSAAALEDHIRQSF